MRFVKAGLALLTASLMLGAFGAGAAETGNAERHGVSLFGELKYAPGFKHFDYVNPQAPKGGEVRYASIGTFDSLNPYIVKGQTAAGLALIYARARTTRTTASEFRRIRKHPIRRISPPPPSRSERRRAFMTASPSPPRMSSGPSRH